MENRIDGSRSRVPILLLVFAAIAITLVFHAPRLWVMETYSPGTFQWDRAHTFLLQVEAPFRTDIEPAMRKRFLVPLIAHVLRLPGYVPLVLPWVGLLAAMTYFGSVLHAWNRDRRFVFGGLLVFATTSAALVPLHWYGLNDAWVWLALLVVAFTNHRWAMALACMLAPWVDERFIVGLPLAYIVRLQLRPMNAGDILALATLAAYPIVRLLMPGDDGHTESTFLQAQFQGVLDYAGVAPLGWWMGLRAAWLPIGYAFVATRGTSRLGLAGAFAITAGVSIFLAFDISRSSAIVIPVVLLGLLMFARDQEARAPSVVFWIGVLGLLLPAVHVVGRKLDPVEMIFVEIMRLL